MSSVLSVTQESDILDHLDAASVDFLVVLCVLDGDVRVTSGKVDVRREDSLLNRCLLDGRATGTRRETAPARALGGLPRDFLVRQVVEPLLALGPVVALPLLIVPDV